MLTPVRSIVPITDEDWGQAFGFAPVGITRDDVAEVVASVDGCNDGDPWVCVCRLRDGRFLYLSAGCDYTGWDCQSSGHGDTRPTLEEVVIELLTEDDRKRLGLPSTTAPLSAKPAKRKLPKPKKRKAP